MIRLTLRLFGLVLLAGAFTALVIDGTRTIAGGSLSITPLGDALVWLAPKVTNLLPQAHQPHLWDPALATVVKLPAFVAAGGLGLLAFVLTQKKRAKNGHSD